MAPHRLDDVGAKLAAEFIDHAGDPRPAGVKGVRSNSFIDLAGGEHLSRSAGQQEKNIKLHRRQGHHLAGLPHKPALRVDLQRAKEQRCFCGGDHCGDVGNGRESRYCFMEDGFLIVVKRKN